ncbi:MAG: acylphosphatase [Methanolinea sp.]|jgi:acylphosphatase|nr:acylphosphatase [Methanolinea sp.]
MKEIRVVVSGRVQGVGYRYFVRDAALRRNIRGFVKNNPDGTVGIVAAGDRDRLEQFLEDIRAKGDPVIRTADISVTWAGEATQEWQGFEIRR